MARQRQLPLNVRFAEEVNMISFRGNIEKVVSMRLLQQQKHDHVQSLNGMENSEDSMKWNGSLTLDEVFKPGSTTSIGSSGGSNNNNNNNNNRRQWTNKFAGKIGSSTSNGGSGSSSNSKERKLIEREVVLVVGAVDKKIQAAEFF
ncbi:hypothetical protein FRACYDRAFT_236660 [Fragilariopsis cylindrus CCMP1102]|uniref:Uncharacterized protein n=1 Tax=Fragilariopsis cylindrus CCMP1102 TaxID=635003 RepID=A0A1E7FKQ4_9STRA|nr:hypothetical protein FRACYDRAFT_236660 [Fragilariopsis cylindrus CCMP1102]|eukprot:OEU18383.1 hypothetical protein FRACYDRAFT_236660 [Fragilariopsis cylindrus CCMP1102]